MNARESLAAILGEFEAETLADLSRTIYKRTAAGVSLAARLDDGTPLWNGSEQHCYTALLDRVVALGVSSIVEGSDAEVPVEWLELDGLDDPVARFSKVVEDTNDEACRLWHEAHDDDSGEAQPVSKGSVGQSVSTYWDSFVPLSILLEPGTTERGARALAIMRGAESLWDAMKAGAALDDETMADIARIAARAITKD